MQRWIELLARLCILGSLASCARRADAPTKRPIDVDISDGASRPMPNAAEGSAPTPTPASSDAGTDQSCEALLDDVRKHGPYGLVAVEGPLRDPVCKWRFDDANGGTDDAIMARFAEPNTLGLVVLLGSAGTPAPTDILPKMRALQPVIRKCLEGDRLAPAIRLRVRVAGDGTVEGVTFDYKVNVAEHARDCVAFAVQHVKLAPDTRPSAAVFTLAFSLRK